MNELQLIITLLSTLAACLAWAAKIYWSKEHLGAKNEIIKSKDEQLKLLEREISTYKELTPMKIREYYLAIKVQFEEYNNLLQSQLDAAQSEIKGKQKQIEGLADSGSKTSLEKSELDKELKELKKKLKQLEEEINRYKKATKKEQTFEIKIPEINTASIDRLSSVYAEMGSLISKSASARLGFVLDGAVAKNFQAFGDLSNQIKDWQRQVAQILPDMGFLRTDIKTEHGGSDKASVKIEK